MFNMKRYKGIVVATMIGTSILTGLFVTDFNNHAFVVQAESTVKSDMFIFNGINASQYNGESVFVITESANAKLANSNESYLFDQEMKTMGAKLNRVNSVVVEDNVTELYCVMLKYFPKATTLQIGKNVKTIHINKYDWSYDNQLNIMKYLSSIKVEKDNPYFTVKDNVLYSSDMKTLYLYPAEKKDTFFSLPDTVINFAGADIGYNQYLLNLHIGKSFEKAIGRLESVDEQVEQSILSGLSSLQEVSVDPDNAYLTTFDKVLYNKQQTKMIAWPQGLVREVIAFPNTLQSITLDTISNKEKVKSITLSRDMNALYVWDFTSRLHNFENLEKIAVPADNKYFAEWKGGLYNKGKTIFYGFPLKSPLKTLEFPKGVTVLEIWQRIYPNIEKIVLPSTFSKFYTHEGGGFTMFYKMFPKLKSVQISSKCKTYKSVDGVVYNKSGTKLITYPSQKIGSSYVVPNKVTSFSDTLFAGSKKLKTLTIGKNLKVNQGMAFYHMMNYSGIKEFKTVKDCKNYKAKDGVLFNKKMTNLEAYPSYKKAETYNVPDSATDISELKYARNLKKLTLGKKVKGLTEFYTLNRLTTISVDKKNPYYMAKNDVLFNKKGTKLIAYPNQKQETSYSIPSKVTNISEDAFRSCKNLKTLNIGKNLKADQYIQTFDSNISAFKVVKDCKNYSAIDGVLYNKKMTKLESYPSERKSSTYEVPDSVIDILRLDYAKKLEKLVFGKSVEKINTLAGYSYNQTSSRLNYIAVDEANPYYKSENGILYNKAGNVEIYNPTK